MVDVTVAAVAKRPEVIRLVFTLDLTKGMRGRRRGRVENGTVEMFGSYLDKGNMSDERWAINPGAIQVRRSILEMDARWSRTQWKIQ